jgi:hypothetical protein
MGAVIFLLIMSCIAHKDYQSAGEEKSDGSSSSHEETFGDESDNSNETARGTVKDESRHLRLFEIQFSEFGEFGRPYTNYFLQLDEPDNASACFIAISENKLYGSNIKQKNIFMPAGNKIELNTWWAGGGEKYFVERTGAGLEVYKVSVDEWSRELDDVIAGDLEIEEPQPDRLFTIPVDSTENIVVDFVDLGRFVQEECLLDDDNRDDAERITLIEIQLSKEPGGGSYSRYFVLFPGGPVDEKTAIMELTKTDAAGSFNRNDAVILNDGEETEIEIFTVNDKKNTCSGD